MYKVTVNGKEFALEYDIRSTVINGKKFEADIIEVKDGLFHIIRNNKSYLAEVIDFNLQEKSLLLRINKHDYEISLRDKYDELLKEMGIDIGGLKKVNEIKAPMPGLVLNVLVKQGQTIRKGDAIVVLEAMKMENILKCPSDGIIQNIRVSKGDKVEKNQVMVNLE